MASFYFSSKDKLMGACHPCVIAWAVYAFGFTTLLILKLNLSFPHLCTPWTDLVKLWYSAKLPTIFLS